ncbi:MAG: hypothetical protein ACFFDW_02215 [Candidatus Thorarchaeota archaeon]
MKERKKERKRIGVVILVVVLFIGLPIVTVSAHLSLQGDPMIECVSSKLVFAQDTTLEGENSSLAALVLFLEVQLSAVYLPASAVNATVSFADKQSLTAKQSLTGIKNDPIIVRNYTSWNTISKGEVKSAARPFALKGFQQFPEQIAFNLETIYLNSFDRTSYTRTETLLVVVPSTTIDIISVSNPPDKPKGDNIPLSITVKNTGTQNAYGMTIIVKAKSIYAGTLTDPYRNAAGTIILSKTTIFLSPLYIAPQQQAVFDFTLTCTGYSNGAMNIGIWKIIQIEAAASNTPLDTIYENDPIISDPNFSVTTKAKTNGPHAVFIYYLWNAWGTGDNWEGDNPRNYFVNGYGDAFAGLWRFSDPNSNIPVLINPMIAYDDNSWSIPDTMDNTDDMIINGKDYIENQLGISTWFAAKGQSNRRNCGFDLLLMAAGKFGDVAGKAIQNMAIACKWRAGLPENKWKHNIDGTVQHEIAHLYGCKDVDTGHDQVACIMAYWTNWAGWTTTYIHEDIIWGSGLQSGLWNTSCSCQTIFDTSWDDYYTIVY